jgi:hypothetical protein
MEKQEAIRKDGQTDREMNIHMERRADRWKDKPIKGERDIMIKRQTLIWKDWQTDRKMKRQDSSTERWKYGQAEEKTERQN